MRTLVAGGDRESAFGGLERAFGVGELKVWSKLNKADPQSTGIFLLWYPPWSRKVILRPRESDVANWSLWW
jgi:hypothetical protein